MLCNYTPLVLLALAVLVRAVARWVQDGGWLGGGRSAGRGACRVAVRSVHHELAREAMDGAEVPPGRVEAQSAEEAVSRVYLGHVSEVAVEARAFLLDAGAGAPKPKKGKKEAA